MRLAKLCITLALATGGWHTALANALCARHADCHAPAASPAPHSHSQTNGRETRNHEATNAADDHNATPAAVAPASERGHCGSQAESHAAVARAAPRAAETEASRGEDENVSPDGNEENASPDGDDVNASSDGSDVNAPPESVANLRAPASSCAHCAGRQTRQPAGASPAAPVFARDTHATPAPARHVFTLTPIGARPRFAPTEHSPPRGRPLHLLNSVLLI